MLGHRREKRASRDFSEPVLSQFIIHRLVPNLRQARYICDEIPHKKILHLLVFTLKLRNKTYHHSSSTLEYQSL